MKILNSSDMIKLDEVSTVVALGNFDGLHKGHLKVIGSMLKYATKNKFKSVVHMYEENPFNIIARSSGDNKKANYIKTIAPREKRIAILKEIGVDILVFERFDTGFSSITCEEFVHNYIHDKMNAKIVCVGYNYSFGYQAMGNTKVLRKLCDELGIQVVIVPPVKHGGEVVSSSRIRSMIEAGNVAGVKKLLGREYSIYGKVVKGKRLGRDIGFPTANIKIDENILFPGSGVYATQCVVDGVTYYSMTHVGVKPTVNEYGIAVETNIFNFDGNLYDEDIEVKFFKKIRDIQRFADMEELKKQLISDRNKVLRYFDIGNNDGKIC